MKWMWIDWLDLPKLTTLRARDGDYGLHSFTFMEPHHITLESDSHPLRMMFRHAQSHRCVSSTCIPLQESRHNPRKYSLHSFLTNRHRSSSKQVQLGFPFLLHMGVSSITTALPLRQRQIWWRNCRKLTFLLFGATNKCLCDGSPKRVYSHSWSCSFSCSIRISRGSLWERLDYQLRQYWEESIPHFYRKQEEGKRLQSKPRLCSLQIMWRVPQLW